MLEILSKILITIVLVCVTLILDGALLCAIWGG